MVKSNIGSLKQLKEYFLLVKEKIDNEKEILESTLGNDAVLKYIRITNAYPKGRVLMLDEEIMAQVLINFGFQDENNIFIDQGINLNYEPNKTSYIGDQRLINESDLEYVNKHIKNNTNPLVNLKVSHSYYGLESGLINRIPNPNDSTIIKLNGLKDYEKRITPLKDDENPNLKSVMLKYDGEPEKLHIIRGQFYLRLIKENPEEVINYYKDIDNWTTIEENVQKYYVKKKELSDNIHSKLSI